MAYAQVWNFDATKLDQPVSTWGKNTADAYELEFNVVSKVGRVDMTSEHESMVYGSEGDYWRITLAENPSTGFQWDIKTDGHIKLVQTNYESGQTQMAGAPGKKTYTVQATGSGAATVSVANSRSWENTDFDSNATLRTVTFALN